MDGLPAIRGGAHPQWQLGVSGDFLRLRTRRVVSPPYMAARRNAGYQYKPPLPYFLENGAKVRSRNLEDRHEVIYLLAPRHTRLQGSAAGEAPDVA